MCAVSGPEKTMTPSDGPCTHLKTPKTLDFHQHYHSLIFVPAIM
jgi:hypothetical protein